MRFKIGTLTALVIFVLSCHKHEIEWEDTALYHATVAVNDEYLTYGILIDGQYKDTLISLRMERVTDDGLYWHLTFSPFSKKSQNLSLIKLEAGQKSPYAFYSGSCCVPPYAPWPDLPAYTYHVWEADSLNNLLHVEVDTSARRLSGYFKVTFVNEVDPFDTLQMSCDEFVCYWE